MYTWVLNVLYSWKLMCLTLVVGSESSEEVTLCPRVSWEGEESFLPELIFSMFLQILKAAVSSPLLVVGK